MPLEVKLQPKLTYKLRLTPQIKLALNLLQLPLAQLKEYIKEEIEKNPLLEPSEDSTSSNGKLDEILKKIENRENKESESDILWTGEDGDKKQYRESLISASLTLQEHLSRQLHIFSNSEDERKIGESIIGNINDNGYLDCPIDEIAESNRTTKSQVEKVLALIQTFDPIGVGARDLRECLWLQLRAKREENSLAGLIVDKYLPFLEKKRYGYIAKKLKRSVEEIKDAIKEIAKLQPRPGCSFSQEITQRLIPDAILKRNKDGYEVIPNDWELPRFGLSAKYKEMLKKNDTPTEVKEYLQERLNAGRSLIDAVNKRQETIQKIIEEIVYTQKDFLDNGATHFKPLTLSQIADRIGKHKSTVSRAISNKYVHTPYGIFKLRDFINSGVKQENGELFSSKTIKTKIRALIESEKKKKPLSDLEISSCLKQEGIFVSRRTITKYRHQLKILPSKSR
ncbi:MAG: RNA polymerase factor sigma-54 [Candidatus Omnitrophota bacterium]|nr:RNA polymerase factor sigma-54 [Candidatus Omnitrophota bacterium]